MGKHKGDRAFRAARLPLHIDEALIEAAASQGLTVNDFIVNAIAASCGLPQATAPRPPLFPPQELELRKAS